MNTYFPGSTVRVEVAWSNADALFDPSTVTCQVIGPASRTILTPAVTKDSTGVYHADVAASDPGLWQYRFAATAPAAAAEGSFVIRASQFVS